MKRLLVMLLLPYVCWGQGARFDTHVMTSTTNVPYGSSAPIYTIPFSTVTVCAYPNVGDPCTNTVAVYQDQALTIPQSNPMMSDTFGRFGFWIAPGQYSYSVVSPSGKFMGTYATTIAGGSGGGGSPPVGVAQEVQTKANSTQFGTSKIFSDGSTSAYTTLPQWAQYARNSPKSAYCNNLQCGNPFIYGQDTPPLNGSGNATGFGQVFSQYRKGLYTSLGQFDGYSGDSNDPAGGTVLQLQKDDVAFHTPSISQGHSIFTAAGKPYDSANFYSYLWCHGGYWGASDEGCTNIKANGGLSFTHQGGMVISGSPGIGATTVTVSQFYSPDDILVGGFVYDANGSPIASGNVIGSEDANHLLTVTPGSVTPATTAGTTSGPITITTPDAVNGVSLTVTVNLYQGTAFTISNTNPVVFACSNPEWEFVVPTAVGTPSGGTQTITANFMHGHSAGCRVAQGGTVGVLDLVADRIGANWKTSYFVFAAPDNSHIYEVSYLQGARGAINPWKHNFGGGLNTLTNAQITGNGTTITACNLGQLSGNFSGQYVQISGATPSTFNGTYTASALDKNLCVSFPGTASGTATGATFAVGGAINSPDGTVQGPGGFKIWPTARIRQMGTAATTTNGITTNAYNNTIYFYPNNFNFIAGHGVLVLDDMQSRTEPLAAVGFDDVAPTPKVNGWFTVSVSGQGVSGDSFRLARLINDNDYSLYKGGGGTGQLESVRGLSIEGPFGANIWMNQPVQAGYGIYMEKTSKTSNPNVNNSFYPMFVQGAGGGGGGFVINYDPNLGSTVISSGTGNGIAAAISMTPTDMALGGTGLFTFFGSTYKFNAFSGYSSAACASLDASGNLGRSCPAFGASGTLHAPGLVPDPGSTPGTTKVLFEDGTWKLPTSGFSGTCASTTTLTVSNGVITGCS